MSSAEQLLEEMHQLHPKSIDLSLDRVYALLEKLGNPHKKLPPVIHVAGTNGKGSVLAFLTAILEAHGDRVQRFSSPHLVDFNERINLPTASGMKPISDELLVDVLSRTKAANDGAPITFFEITTVAAFLAFSESQADWCLLETGLGGRLDATNVIDQPAATLITPVSIDHTGFLGETIAEIAREKAGILKKGSKAFIGQQERYALEEISARGETLDLHLYVRGLDYDVYEQRGRLVFSSPDELIDLPLPRYLIGRHQIENAGLAILTAQQLLRERLDHSALASAMLMARWPARMQRLFANDHSSYLRAGDELWLDGGHNPSAAGVLAELIGDLEERVPRPLHLIIGMMQGKDLAGFLHEFRGLASGVIAVPVPGTEAGMDPDDLADLALELGFEAETARDVTEALQLSSEGRHEDARILICGSLYLAGDVLRQLRVASGVSGSLSG